MGMARASLVPGALSAAAAALCYFSLMLAVQAQLQDKWYASDTWIRPPVELHLRYLGQTHRAIWQSNCELVLASNDEAYWSTQTAQYHNHVCYLAMQFDGNLVIYGDDNKPLWASDSPQQNRGNYYAQLQTDSNLVIYNENGQAIWASNTVQ